MTVLFHKPQDAFTPQGKSNEWYTPSKYVEAARQVMGGITLDPASCEIANRTVKAKHYYTKEDDGLAQGWRGNVWLNPPYGREGGKRNMAYTAPGTSVGKLWIDKLIHEYSTGKVSQAILLGKADVKQIWFVPLWDYPICFAHNRVYFDRPGLPSERIMFGTVFVYLGPNIGKFITEFSAFGRIAKAIDTPKPAIVHPSLWEVK
jgi:phage N-6-adenine-methyltransferase